MGMDSGQVRLLALTRRSNKIGEQLQHCAITEMSLTREMRQVTADYQNALSAKKLMLSNNSGVTKTALNYSALMRPGIANKNQPYLLTDSSGRIVLDRTYADYARMLSPGGNPVSLDEWEANKAAILSSLTGISEADLELLTSTNSAVGESNQKINNLQSQLNDKLKHPPTNCVSTITATNIKTNLGLSGTIDLGTDGNATGSALASKVTEIENQLKGKLDDGSISKNDAKSWEDACNNVRAQFSELTLEKLTSLGVEKKDDKYSMSVDALIAKVLNEYQHKLKKDGSASFTQLSTGDYAYTTHNIGSSEWTTWKAELDALKTELEAEKATQQTNTDTANGILKAGQESDINFYEQIFTAICENGWTENDEIQDEEYLNQMLLNNQFYITQMTEKEDEEGNYYYEYNMGLASDTNTIYIVNDEDAREDALAEYENRKAEIEEKESRNDTRRANLQTEQSAIMEMMKGIQKCIQDNEQRNFSIMS